MGRESEIFPSNRNLTFDDRLTFCRRIRNAVFSVRWQTVFQKSFGVESPLVSPLTPCPIVFCLDLGSAFAQKKNLGGGGGTAI